MGCHDSEESAVNQMKALYANEKSAAPAENRPQNAQIAPETTNGSQSRVAIGSQHFAIEWRTKTEGRLNTIVEFRVKPGVKPMLAGHAAVFDQLSEELGFFETFREIIKPGAFTETLKNSDVRALWNHDPNFPLGRVRSRTLRLSEDAIGLHFEIDMPATDYAQNIMELVERGDVNQGSFAFSVPEGGESWKKSEGGLVRELSKINLFDVSPVTFPAYTQTDVGIRKEIRSIADQLINQSIIDQKTGQEALGSAWIFTTRDIILAARKPITNEEEKEMAELAARNESRKRFLEGREPKIDPLSYENILKRARKKSEF